MKKPEKKKISFLPKDKEFITELRKKVKQHFQENNKPTHGGMAIILKALFMLGLYIVPYLLMITGTVQSTGAILGCWILMGFGMAGLGMTLMHDANHGTFSKNKKANKWFGKSLYLLGGFPPNWRHQHNTLHHGYTNINGYDEDISPVGILRFSPHEKLRKVHRFQFIYAWFFYGLMTFSWITNKDFKQFSKYKKDGASLSRYNNYVKLYLDMIFSKLLYYVVMLVIPLLVLPIPWYLTLLFFFAMHFTSGVILGTIFQTAHVMPTSAYPLPDKSGKIENNWAVHQLSTTSDFAPSSKLLTWLIGGLNFQVEHHLFPNISHVHYKDLSYIVQEVARKYNLPYFVQPNLLVAVRGHAKMLMALGRCNKAREEPETSV
jgi:linoleoyl-CoA desaturase